MFPVWEKSQGMQKIKLKNQQRPLGIGIKFASILVDSTTLIMHLLIVSILLITLSVITSVLDDLQKNYFSLIHYQLLEASQELDPRVEWKTLQEEMLRSYLATAESDLKAKQELVDIKQQRLHLAQHDLNHLNTTLSTLSTSTTSRKFE